MASETQSVPVTANNGPETVQKSKRRKLRKLADEAAAPVNNIVVPAPAALSGVVANSAANPKDLVRSLPAPLADVESLGSQTKAQPAEPEDAKLPGSVPTEPTPEKFDAFKSPEQPAPEMKEAVPAEKENDQEKPEAEPESEPESDSEPSAQIAGDVLGLANPEDETAERLQHRKFKCRNRLIGEVEDSHVAPIADEPPAEDEFLRNQPLDFGKAPRKRKTLQSFLSKLPLDSPAVSQPVLSQQQDQQPQKAEPVPIPAAAPAPAEKKPEIEVQCAETLQNVPEKKEPDEELEVEVEVVPSASAALPAIEQPEPTLVQLVGGRTKLLSKLAEESRKRRAKYFTENVVQVQCTELTNEKADGAKAKAKEEEDEDMDSDYNPSEGEKAGEETKEKKVELLEQVKKETERIIRLEEGEECSLVEEEAEEDEDDESENEEPNKEEEKKEDKTDEKKDDKKEEKKEEKKAENEKKPEEAKTEAPKASPVAAVIESQTILVPNTQPQPQIQPLSQPVPVSQPTIQPPAAVPTELDKEQPMLDDDAALDKLDKEEYKEEEGEDEEDEAASDMDISSIHSQDEDEESKEEKPQGGVVDALITERKKLFKQSDLDAEKKKLDEKVPLSDIAKNPQLVSLARGDNTAIEKVLRH